MAKVTYSAALRVFDSIFRKYLVYVSQMVGLDLSKRNTFVNFITRSYIVFLGLSLFSVFYTIYISEIQLKLMALAALGPITQVNGFVAAAFR